MPRRLVARLWIVMCAVSVIAERAWASNIETGEPCNIGVTTAAERTVRAALWLAPPSVIGMFALVILGVALIKSFRPGSMQRRWMIALGVSSAVLVAALLALAAAVWVLVASPLGV